MQNINKSAFSLSEIRILRKHVFLFENSIMCLFCMTPLKHIKRIVHDFNRAKSVMKMYCILHDPSVFGGGGC